jgi:hypothetical protein
MTERSLSNLYRRMDAEAVAGAAGLLDADTLVDAAAGSLKGDRRDEVAGLLSRSPLQTDLVRLLRELEPDAERLADALHAGRPALAHVRSPRSPHHADTARRHARQLRWAGLAACLMLVFGALVWNPGLRHSGMSTGDPAAEAMVKPDRIFTSKDRIFAITDDRVPQAAVDSVFRSDFNEG